MPITISTPDISGETDGDTTFVRTYNPATDVTITAPQTADNGNTFIESRRNGTPISTNLSINVSMLSDVEVTAVYGEPTDNRWLAVRSINPDSEVPIKIDLPDRKGKTDGETAFSRLYHNGDTVTATAPPTADGNQFKQWFLDGSPYSTNRTITVQMWQNHQITAEYGPPPQPTDVSLYVDSVNPQSGVPISVSETDNNGNKDGDTVFVRTYTVGDTVTLTAPPQGGTNNTYFSHWELDGTKLTENRTVTVEMLTDHHLTAVYGSGSPPATMTVNARKTDGTVVTTIIGVAPTDMNGHAVGTTEFTRKYENGTTVTLDAPENADGDKFVRWERNGTPLSTNRTINIEMLADTVMTAIYGPEHAPEDVNLTVKSVGPDGSLHTFIPVTPDKNGQAGGTTTYTRRYINGTQVTLVAPDNNGSLIFDHWELNGSPYTKPGSGDTTITIDMLSNNTVTAVYITDPHHSGQL